ncbi:hypothetical protein ACT3CE_18810 [Marinifilum sp. RC60d5]|uniref:hypothetical protein n=1 Tax=Marinifilum sp. RC60d5 TaxID=3458414 RepID=UPI0040365619
MKNFEKLTGVELASIQGGRMVNKIDLTGDGEWDIKEIIRNDGTIVIKTRK